MGVCALRQAVSRLFIHAVIRVTEASPGTQPLQGEGAISSYPPSGRMKHQETSSSRIAEEVTIAELLSASPGHQQPA